MIDRYLTNGTMYVLEDDGVKAECVVLDAGGGVLEIKNIATDPQFHGKGYGKALIEFNFWLVAEYLEFAPGCCTGDFASQEMQTGRNYHSSSSGACLRLYDRLLLQAD